MPSTDTRQLQLQISASAELMIRNLKQADNAVAEFQRKTDSRLASIDQRFAALGDLKGKLAGIGVGDLVGAATGASLIALAKRGLDYASSLGEVSQQLGVTTKDLQTYRYAATQVGIEQETIDKSLAKLTVTLGKARLGAEEPTKAFNALGISIASVNGKTAGDVIPKIADGLAKISDPAKRAALEVTLFGKAGQQLDTLLAGGSSQINELSTAAQKLGLVLSDEQIQHADDTADKLSAIKQVLEAQVASIVADNATSILSLANALGQLTGATVNFLNSNPQTALSIIGALAGGRVGGLPGAAAGVIVGYAAGQGPQQAADDANRDLAYRRRKLKVAEDELAAREASARGEDPNGTIFSFGGIAGKVFRLRTGDTGVRSGTTIESAQKEVQRQRALLASAQKPIAQPKSAVPAATDIAVPKIFAPSGPKGPSADALAARAAAAARKDRGDQRRADDLLSREQIDLRGAQADLSNNPDERLKLEQDRIELARQAKDRDLELAALDNRYVAANLDRLKAINADTASIDKQLAAQRRAQDIDQAAYERTRAAQDDEIALLQVQESLTNIAKERHAIEQRILAIRQQEERDALDRVINDKNGRYSISDRQLAKEQRDRLPAKQEAERAALAQQTQGPIASYRDQLKANTDDINTALENVGARGLQTLEDGLLGVVQGTETLSGAFKRLAASIIADLARIAIEKAIVSAIGGGIFGFAGGGQIPGFAAGGLPGFAGGTTGGQIKGPGTGRSDSILAILGGAGGAIRVSNGEFIVNERATQAHLPLLMDINSGRLPKFANGGPVTARLPSLAGAGQSGGGRGPISFDLRGAVVTADLLKQMQTIANDTAGAVVLQSAPAIVNAAGDHTIARLSRRKL
jgi:hypothetical protein